MSIFSVTARLYGRKLGNYTLELQLKFEIYSVRFFTSLLSVLCDITFHTKIWL